MRDNPLGFNEGATGEAQLWVLVSQIRQELELARKAEVLVTDRGVMDNFAYYLRACGGEDRFSVEPLVRAWSATYDLVVRLTPDIALRADGVRSTNDAFRDEVEAILDARLPALVRADRLVTVPACEVTDSFDWWPIAERLAAIVGEPLLADDLDLTSRSTRGPGTGGTPAPDGFSPRPGRSPAGLTAGAQNIVGHQGARTERRGGPPAPASRAPARRCGRPAPAPRAAPPPGRQARSAT